MYADKLMIWNPGHLPPLWTVAKLTGKHSSQPPNPDIANAFFRAGEIEAWGWGIERMLSACRDAGCPEPLFEYEQPGLWVTFPFAPEIVALTGGEGAGETTVETPGKRLGKTPGRILDLLRANPNLTVPEIAAELSKSESAVNRAVHKLQAEGRLRRVGSRKAGHWEIPS